LNTVKEEILGTGNDHEMQEKIFPIETSETLNDICPEIHEFQESVESQLSEISQVTRVSEVQESLTIIPVLTYEYAAAQIAYAIPARESREVSNEDPIINVK
jgi:hypothetical protein